MPRLIVIIILLHIYFVVYSQRSVRTTGVAQVELTEEKSRREVRNEARDLAIINALERAFGRVVIQGNTTYISNITTGKKNETKSVFNMIANTTVNGEVESVLSEDYSDVRGYKQIDGKQIEIVEIKCEVTIRAREIVTPPVEYKAFHLWFTNFLVILLFSQHHSVPLHSSPSQPSQSYCI